MLEVKQLSVRYGSFLAVDRIDLSVKTGEIVGLIGPNGAGKTSLLGAVSGIVSAAGGSIFYREQEIDAEPARVRLAKGLVLVPEVRGIFPMMSVHENLLVGAYRCNDRTEIQRRMENVFRLFPVLAERQRQLASTMSGGQQQMVAIASGLMAAPKLLLLDEPSIGLAPVVIKEIANTLQMLRDEGLSILLSEQNAKLATAISDRVYVLQTGRIQMARETASLMDDPAFVEAYLSLA
jgi:branched-chain amino acid transport system ATP-binding protein